MTPLRRHILVRLAFLCVIILALPLPAVAHPGHSDTRPDRSSRDSSEQEGERILPDLIKVFDIVRFTRSQHRALHHRLENNIGKSRIVGMSHDLALATTAAGEVSSRDVGRLFFRMWQAKSLNERKDVLARQETTLIAERDQLAVAAEGTGLNARTANRKLRANALMIALVKTWQANPMDGFP